MCVKLLIKAVVLVCFLKFAQPRRKFNSLRIKYGMDITEAYYEIPTSTKSPLMIDYEMVQPEPDYKLLIDFYCFKDDPRVCFMYDKRGNIAGCQISMLVEDLKHVRPMYYNYSAIGNFFVTNFLKFPAYSQRTYFTNPEILTEQGRQNISEIAEGLWTYLDGKLVQIQRRRPEQKISQDFYSQGCILGMGSHYFYKINPNASCDDSFPLFASYDEESLVGYGMIFVGYGSHGPERGWYEHPVNEALLVFSLFCLVQACCAWRKFNDLRVKTNAFGIDKKDAFIEIPRNTKSPLMSSYSKAAPEPGFKFLLDFYCKKNDPRVCAMFDKKGNVAGLQISVLKSDMAHIKKTDYDFDAVKEYTKTNFFNVPAYSSRVYFTNPEKLNNNGRQNPEETADGLWTYLDGKLFEIQRKEPTGPKMGDFDRQGCYPEMGQHYVYKYNKNSSCKNHYSLFPLYEKGGLVGYGYSAPAVNSKLNTDWWEKPTGDVLKVVLPNPPKCSGGNGSITTYISLHVFLVDSPWEISCP